MSPTPLLIFSVLLAIPLVLLSPRVRDHFESQLRALILQLHHLEDRTFEARFASQYAKLAPALSDALCALLTTPLAIELDTFWTISDGVAGLARRLNEARTRLILIQIGRVHGLITSSEARYILKLALLQTSYSVLAICAVPIFWIMPGLPRNAARTATLLYQELVFSINRLLEADGFPTNLTPSLDTLL